MRLGVPVLFVDCVLTFTMLSIVPVLPISIFYYRSSGNQRRSNSYDRFCAHFQDRLLPSEVQPKHLRPLERPTGFPALHNLRSLGLVS